MGIMITLFIRLFWYFKELIAVKYVHRVGTIKGNYCDFVLYLLGFYINIWVDNSVMNGHSSLVTKY